MEIFTQGGKNAGCTLCEGNLQNEYWNLLSLFKAECYSKFDPKKLF